VSYKKQSYRVLVVEDNPGDYILIQNYLEGNHNRYETLNTRTFQETHSLISKRDEQVDVVLLDLTLPDSRGTELIREMIQLAEPAPIIVLTGYEDIDFSIKSLSMGVSDYLLKDELSSNRLWKSILYSIERKEIYRRLEDSEKRYKKLFENNPSPMIIYDSRSRRLVDSNVEALKMYGYTKDEILSLTIDDIKIRDGDRFTLDSYGLSGTGGNIHMHKNKEETLIYMEENAHAIEFKGKESVLMLLNNVTEKVNLQEKIVEHSIQAEEQERNRIAQEIHDGIIQQLVACGLFTQNLHDIKYNSELLDQKISRLFELIKKITDETRLLSHKLKSAEIETMTLSEMTGQLVQQLKQSSKIDFILKDFIPESTGMSHSVKTNLYRSLQELCNNIIKHSRASNAVISMEVVDQQIFLSVSDNGIGIADSDEDNSGIGIANVKRRIQNVGGSIQFIKKNSGGLTVAIDVPLNYNE
jgi:PAS domain S-box-containing protein